MRRTPTGDAGALPYDFREINDRAGRPAIANGFRGGGPDRGEVPGDGGLGARLRPMEIRGERVVLRTTVDEDAEMLHEVLREPEVAAWWAPMEGFEEMLSVTLRDGRVIGAIEYDEELDEDYRHASIDVFLSARHHGRGLGTDAVRTLARWLVQERGHHRITIDPAASNAAAIRCYTNVGFKPVGIMREYERDPLTGKWRDGLLMDLLARELAG